MTHDEASPARGAARISYWIPVALVVGLLKHSTDRRTNDLVEQREALAADKARRDELRADLKQAEGRADFLQGEVDRLRSERNEARELLATRRLACTETGNPCRERLEALNRLVPLIHDANTTTDGKPGPAKAEKKEGT